MTDNRQLAEDKARSYKVRAQLGADYQYHDWSERGRTVFVRARRDTFYMKAGEVVQLVSTSNAGFAGITALGRRDGKLVHLGSLGAYDLLVPRTGLVMQTVAEGTTVGMEAI